jgi:DNA recombination protein RmuC
MSLTLVLLIAAGVAAGAGLIGYLLGASRRAREFEARLLAETGLRTAAEANAAQASVLRAELAARDAEVRSLGASRERALTELAARERALAEQRALLDTAQAALADAFRSLAADSLRANNQQFIELAKSQFETLQQAARGDLDKRQLGIQQLVEPVRESLEKVQARIGEIENSRIGAYSQLLEQVSSLALGQADLKRETGNLVGALRRPSVRGRWGELQLKRVVELAGMVDRVDFIEQPQVTAEGGDLRPDLRVRLPGGRNVIVDAKAPLEAYLESLELADETARSAKLAQHARQIRDHITRLSQKQYWDQFENTPDFVVLFIPGEMFYSAALEQDPELIEIGMNRKVLIATPTTLIALLRTVAYGWRQEALAENARAIAALGKELYERIQVMAGHWGSMGQGLRRALTAYNDAVGSLEARVLPAARRFRDLEVGTEAKEIEAPAPLDQLPREIQAEEMRREALPLASADPERERH